ncbi:cryptochrome/photolyase family protein [Ramlibacter rhizophilus]|uniref:Deoxyribodipyrimidine photo-lyase n=1 Tax=Ramlibacter rhizophilus TaxID=1781167 RepID=A0A4Z0BRP2_9BURK|nr:deoxyribodipyrimidine photo-lyase [Ramlibacter rhizophilus]TFZ01070.1 deoxyribodipyrimidine photo-lyase [Ramlibacter rhizophilus]
MSPTPADDKNYDAGLMWFRRDLRPEDNAAFAQCLAACRQVHAVFVFDRAILGTLPRRDRRVEFIRESLVPLDEALREMAGSPAAGLVVLHDLAEEAVPRLAAQLGVQAVFANHDDEPAALQRDAAVRRRLAAQGIALHTAKDHTVFERGELLTQTGKPYSVYSPYRRAWRAKLDAADLAPHRTRPRAQALAERPPAHRQPIPTLAELGFERTNLADLPLPAGIEGGQALLKDFLARIDRYQDARDFPAQRGPSYLSVHLRFGTVSIRELARLALERERGGSAGAATWLDELIWRDFYFQILANFPHVADVQGNGHSFRPEYDAIVFEDGARAEALFAAWCEGRTGYPLVDAAMHQLKETGYMHNRLRMVTASFLSKDLGIDWRWGERYFARQLNDYDLAANNGGWQWAASTGCDAQPWFRIFNPVTQSERFDPQGRFILQYLPHLVGLQGKALHAPWQAAPLELEAAGLALGTDYPRPVVDHAGAREETLRRYGAVKERARSA